MVLNILGNKNGWTVMVMLVKNDLSWWCSKSWGLHWLEGLICFTIYHTQSHGLATLREKNFLKVFLAFFTSPECFYSIKGKFCHFSHCWFVIYKVVEFGQALTCVFNPFPHNDTFWRPWETSLLKTLWEKEKLLVTSNFPFSHSVFYLFG